MQVVKILTVIVFLIILLLPQAHAQLPQQIKILNNPDRIPFEDGKTIIAETDFGELNSDTNFLRVLELNKTMIKAGDLF